MKVDVAIYVLYASCAIAFAIGWLIGR